jgi:hypothetical protein
MGTELLPELCGSLRERTHAPYGLFPRVRYRMRTGFTRLFWRLVQPINRFLLTHSRDLPGGPIVSWKFLITSPSLSSAILVLLFAGLIKGVRFAHCFSSKSRLDIRPLKSRRSLDILDEPV